MTATKLTTRSVLGALAVALALGAAFTANPAEAGRGKEYFSEVYRFNKPHDGYSGFAGAHFCDYQKRPVRECSVSRSGRQVCKKVWLLRQHCY